MIFKAEGLSYCRAYRAEAPINIFLSFRCRLLAPCRSRVFMRTPSPALRCLGSYDNGHSKCNRLLKALLCRGKTWLRPFSISGTLNNCHPWRCKGIIHGFIPCRSSIVVCRRLLTGLLRSPRRRTARMPVIFAILRSATWPSVIELARHYDLPKERVHREIVFVGFYLRHIGISQIHLAC